MTTLLLSLFIVAMVPFNLYQIMRALQKVKRIRELRRQLADEDAT